MQQNREIFGSPVNIVDTPHTRSQFSSHIHSPIPSYARNYHNLLPFKDTTENFPLEERSDDSRLSGFGFEQFGSNEELERLNSTANCASLPFGISTSSGYHSISSQNINASQSMFRDRSIEQLALTGQGGFPHPTQLQPHGMNFGDRPRPASARGPYPGDLVEHGHMGPGSSTRHRAQQSYPQNELRGSSMEQIRDPAYMSRGQQPSNVRRVQPTFTDQPQTSQRSVSGGRRAHSYDYNLEKQTDPAFGLSLPRAGPSVKPTRISEPIAGGNIDLGGFPTLMNYDYNALADHPMLMSLGQPLDSTAVQREYGRVSQELEISREKLSACMTSIRTFWSPELKRERAMRKEESAKYAILADHLHQLQLEKQNMLQNMHNMETEVQRLRSNQRPDQLQGMQQSELDVTKRRVDELTRENRQLMKEVEEYERKLSDLKSSLGTTEESLARLVEAVKSGKSGSEMTGIRIDRLESDRQEIDRLRYQLSEANQRANEADRQLVDRDFDYNKVKETSVQFQQEAEMLKQENEALRRHTQQTQTLQALVDTKESKILTLENEIHLLEDEISRLRDEGIVTPNTSMSSGIEDLDKTIQSFRSNERLLKSKIEMQNGELSKRDSEIYALQSRLEMLEKQQQDQAHHVDVLKEQVKTREHKISMLAVDHEDFRKRLKEKDSLLEKKTKSMNSAQTNKRQLEAEIGELKEQLDIRERKISLLQRKINNLEDLLNEKESQLGDARSRLARLSSGAEGARAGHEESIKEKERMLDKMRESKDRFEYELTEELEVQKRVVHELRGRLDNMQNDLTMKSDQLHEARDELSELRAQKFSQETELSQLQSQLGQKQSELVAMQVEKQLLQKQALNESELKHTQRISDLESQVTHYMESAGKLQTEVDRLLGLIRNMETEKLDKDNHIQEVEEQLHEGQNMVNTLKRNHQLERKKLTQMLDESRQRLDSFEAESNANKSTLAEKQSRIHELEQALRESVRLTAERDIYATGREEATRQLEQQIRDLRSNVEQLQRERNSLSAQLANVQEEVRDREAQLKTLENECFQGYIPELDKMRRGNYELNLRVAALLKIMQGREYQLTDQDKQALAGISMFPGGQMYGSGGGIGAGNSYVLGPTGQTTGGWTTVLGLPRTTPIAMGGGSTSPHLAGSAFQFVGQAQAQTQLQTGLQPAMTRSGAYSAGMRSPMHLAQQQQSAIPGHPAVGMDTLVFTKLLSEKESAQHVQELAKLRFQNGELEVKLKALQRENAQANQMQASTGTSSGELTTELTNLRQQNVDLSSRLEQLRRSLNEREERLRLLESRQNYDLALDLDRARKEMNALQAESTAKSSMLNRELEHLKKSTVDLNNNVTQLQSQLREQETNVHILELEKSRVTAEHDAMQKKYQSVLVQLTEKTEQIQQLERDCYHSQTEEIKRLKLENEEYERRVTFMQRTVTDRETRCEQIERELMNNRETSASLRSQYHTVEMELKTMREESVHREERIRQMQTQHADEVSRLRASSQEQASKASHMRLALEENEHHSKMLSNELDKCRGDMESTKRRLRECECELTQQSHDFDHRSEKFKTMELDYAAKCQELDRAQASLDEATARANVLQKRIEERELRLRKIEKDNNNLLDEIHKIRKTNQEAESQIDTLRQHLLSFEERPMSRASCGSPTSFGRHHYSSGEMQNLTMLELDRIRKQNSELLSDAKKSQRALEDAQIQLDQVTLERNQLKQELANLRERLDALMQTQKPPEEAIPTIASQSQPLPSAVSTQQELQEKDLQIRRLTEQLERLQTTVNVTSDNMTDSLAELQNALQQACLERDQAREHLNALRAHAEFGSLDAQQQYFTNQSSLQQQVLQLQQSQREANAEVDRLKRDAKTAATRVQDLSRQLSETQTQSDEIARQRDQLADRLTQLERALPANGQRSGQLSGLPASASAGHLSRELDRLHREQEETIVRLEETEVQARTYRTECDSLKNELRRLRDDLARSRDRLKELQEQAEAREDEMSKLQRLEADKAREQVQEMSGQLAKVQQELSAKDSQIERMVNDFERQQRICDNLERNLRELSEAQQRNELDDNERERHHFETEALTKEIEIREHELKKLQKELQQSNQEVQQLQSMLEEMSEQLQATKDDLARTKQEARDAIDQASAWAKEQEQRFEAKMSQNQSTSASQADQMRQLEQMRQELSDANKARRDAETQLDEVQRQLDLVIKDLEEKTERVQILEVECFQQQAEELDRLRKELKAVSSGQMQGQPSIQSLKQDLEILRRELGRRDDTITKMDRECQENHIKKLEAVQLQLRRYEDEASNLSRVLDEQRAGLEERDRLIRQLRADGGGGNLADYERLKAEHAHCSQQLEQRAKQINTLANQLEGQTEEILSIKQEALTASLCEKDANIALIEVTAPKGQSTDNLLEKMRAERGQIQTQLKQLSTARAAMMEEKKSRPR